MATKSTKKQNKNNIIKKLKFSKKHLAMILSGTIVLGLAGGLYKLGEKHGVKETQQTLSDKNEIGHDNINPIFNFNIDENDFVLLDVGDHDSVKTNFQHRKMTMCNEQDISLGIIISSNAKNECDIYDDVEYVKGLIRDYEINLPVYLDVDYIMDNKKLNRDMKLKIIQDFLEKCSLNNIYVGIAGTDTNLCRVRDYLEITSYDAYVIMDSREIKYDGTYRIYKDLNGNIISTDTNLASYIESKNLNKASGFINDESYVIHEKQELEDIALRCGLSINDILKFNGLSMKDIKDGIIVRIPSKPSNGTATTEYTPGVYSYEEEPLRGCDLSNYQAGSCNWDQLSENFDYIILKCNQGLVTDLSFDEFIKNCAIYNIPTGVYCFNNYIKTGGMSLEEFKKKQEAQADYTISLLKNKKIDYPVYLDIENTNEGKISKETMPKEYEEAMLEIWYKKISSAGYIPGVYCNQSTFDLLNSQVDYHLADKFELWIAGGDQYTGGNQGYYFEDIRPSSVLYKEYIRANMAQSTDTATGAGAGNSAGFLDIDYSKIDYTQYKIVEDGVFEYADGAFEIKSYNRVNKVVPIALLAGGGVIAGFSVKTLLEKKKKKKRKSKKSQQKTKIKKKTKKN